MISFVQQSQYKLFKSYFSRENKIHQAFTIFSMFILLLFIHWTRFPSKPLEFLDFLIWSLNFILFQFYPHKLCCHCLLFLYILFAFYVFTCMRCSTLINTSVLQNKFLVIVKMIKRTRTKLRTFSHVCNSKLVENYTLVF